MTVSLSPNKDLLLLALSRQTASHHPLSRVNRARAALSGRFSALKVVVTKHIQIHETLCSTDLFIGNPFQSVVASFSQGDAELILQENTRKFGFCCKQPVQKIKVKMSAHFKIKYYFVCLSTYCNIMKSIKKNHK